MTSQKIIRIARFGRLKKLLIFLLATVLFSFGLYYSIVKEATDTITIVLTVILLLASFIAVIWNIVFLIWPLHEKIFRRAGSVEKAAELLEYHEAADIVYTDRYVTITEFAISFNKEPLHVIDVYDILAVFKERRSVDSMLESDCLIIVDAWGEQHIKQYRRRSKKDVDAAIEALKEVCDPELTKFGRTVEAIEWIAHNSSALPKYNMKTKKIETPEPEVVNDKEPRKEAAKTKKTNTQNKQSKKQSSKKKATKKK